MPEKDAPSHELIPQHKLLSKGDGEKVLEEFKVTRSQIPKIRIKDAALVGMGVKPGSIVQITRLDGSVYYRLAVEA